MTLNRDVRLVGGSLPVSSAVPLGVPTQAARAAQDGGEGAVQLPFADGPENRRHPLHVLVHTGQPGQHVEIGVLGTASDPCSSSGSYVNQR